MLIRDVPFSMVQMAVYEYLRHKQLGESEENFLGHYQSMLIGAIAGLTAALATNPLDVIKTNIMT